MAEKRGMGRVAGMVAIFAGFIGLASAYSADKEVEFSVPAEGTAEFRVLQDVYRARIAPILESKCFMCHSTGKKARALQRLDMTNGFPFKGAGSNGSRMANLNREVREGGMPPFAYLLFNWSGGLTKAESALIIDWTDGKLVLSGTITGSATVK